MPSITSIINTLLRVLPDDDSLEIYKSINNLYPKSENLATRDSVNGALRSQLSHWHTRLVFNTSRNWLWPYWLNIVSDVTSPHFSPSSSESPLPNLRGTDAIPVPGAHSSFYGMLDPRGMLVPRHNSFALETWVIRNAQVINPALILDNSMFSYKIEPDNVSVTLSHADFSLTILARGLMMDEALYIHLNANLRPTDPTNSNCSLAYAIRPYNLQSVVNLKDLVYNSRGFWMSDSRIIAWSLQKPEQAWASNSDQGDSYLFLAHPPERTATRCPVGLANGLNVFPTDSSGKCSFDLIVPAEPALTGQFPFVELPRLIKNYRISPGPTHSAWSERQKAICSHVLPRLTDVSSAVIRDLLKDSPHCIYPFIQALLGSRLTNEAASILSYILLSLQKNGDLHYAYGHWEVHGQLLTALKQFQKSVSPREAENVFTYATVRKLARWIIRKRREMIHAPTKPKGLLPPGLIRSGMGTEYNLVDNLWAIEGLAAASELALTFTEPRDAETFRKEADILTNRLTAAINRELEYSMNLLLPGKLFRSFEAGAASELLDLEHMDHSGTIYRGTDWYSRLINHLASPIADQQHNGKIYTRNIDSAGFCPARRILLQRAFHQQNPALAKELHSELNYLENHTGLWSNIVDSEYGRGLGKSFTDPEATSLVAQLVKTQNNKTKSNNPQN